MQAILFSSLCSFSAVTITIGTGSISGLFFSHVALYFEINDCPDIPGILKSVIIASNFAFSYESF